MTDYQHQPEQVAMRGLLQAVRNELGHDVAPEWQGAAFAAPRHHFLPERIWLDDRAGGYTPCDRATDPERWFAAAYADAPVVTQVNDGADPGDGSAWPSSSLSAPSIVFRMLEDLDLHDGDTVFEVGTGNGLNTAYLCHRLGDDHVVTGEIDKALADCARTALNAAGYNPLVLSCDGADGDAPRSPYSRILATCSVRKIPRAWIEQTLPGGLILTPWDNPWICWGLLRLAVGQNNTAVGRFSPHSAFMLMRSQRAGVTIADLVKDEHQVDESKTTLPRRSVVWGDAAFAVGLCLGDVGNVWEDNPVDGVADRLWLATTDGASWAAVDHDGGDHDEFTVRQYGPRRLWDETESAYRWWLGNGQPGPGRFGLTISSDGTHQPWLDVPGNALPI